MTQLIFPPIVLQNNGVKIINSNKNMFAVPHECHEIGTLISLYHNIQAIGYNEIETFQEYVKFQEYLEILGAYLDKAKTLQLLAVLPICSELLRTESSKEYYQGMFLWLHCWENNSSTTHLQSSDWKHYEPFAILSKRRYELISALFSRKKVDEILFINPNLAWILAETSIFWRKLHNDRGKNNLYKNCKEHLDNLGGFEKTPDSFEVQNKDLQFKYADFYFETLARDVARNEPTFDKGYFQPYLLAFKSANSYFHNHLAVVDTQGQPLKEKPGGKLGSKKARNKTPLPKI